MKNNLETVHIKKIPLLYIILALALVMSLAAYIFYRNEESDIRQKKNNELRTIAELKISQVSEWHSERINDALIIPQSPFFIEKVNLFINKQNDRKLRDELHERLMLLYKESHYRNLILSSVNGEIIISLVPGKSDFDPFVVRKIREAVKYKKITNTDIFYSKTGNNIHYDIIAPIINKSDQTIGALIFEIDPEYYLYPLVQAWPVTSRSSETVLARKEKDSVLILNRLRFQDNTRLKIQFPLTRNEIPAVQAALGTKGIVEGKDYRGVEVLAFIGSIPNTGWMIITKIDRHELYSDIYSLWIVVTGITIAVIFFCGVGFALFYNQRQKNIYKELYKKEKELWESHEQFKVTVDSIGDGVITTDVKGKIEYMNRLAEELTGWNFRDARGRGLEEIYKIKNEETGETEINAVKKVLEYGIVKGLANHTILIPKNGKELAIMDTGAPIYNSNGIIIGIVLSFRDETEKRKQQRQLKDSEELFSTTFRTSPVGITLTRLNDGQFIQANDSFLKTYGYKESEVIGHTVFELNILVNADERKEYVKLLNEKGKFSNLEIVFRKKSGETGIASLSGELLNFKNEKYFLSAMHDITDRKKAEEALLISEAKYRNTLENMIEGCQIIGYDWRYLYVNNAAARHGHKPKNEYTGKTMMELYPGIEDTNMFSKLRFCMEKRISISIDNEFLYPDGSSGFFELIVQPVPEGIFILSVDVTGQKRSEKELNLRKIRFDRLVSGLNDIVWTGSIDGTPLEINEAFENIYGVSTKEFLANPDIWLDRVLPEDKQIAISSNEKLFSTGYSEAEYRIVRPDGSIRWIFDRKSMTYDNNGEPKEVGGIAADITERKQAEHELIKAKEKAEEMNRVKTNFFANMSHELRTPFVGIMGYAELLKEMEMESEANEIVEGILTTSKRLVDTLTKILDLTKIEFEVTDLIYSDILVEEVIDDVLNKYSKAANRSNLYLKKMIQEGPIYIHSDQHLLSEILDCLVSNAVKFTHEGGVELTAVKAISDEKEFVIIKVTDTGIGIPKEKHEIIWEEFRQASEGSTRSYQGVGLGLTISRKYAEKLGGTIYVESEEGKGSSFILELPA